MMAAQEFRIGKPIQFHWMITFDWKKGETSPFQFYLFSVFNNQVPDAWFNREITDTLRQEQHEIAEFPKKKFSFFVRSTKVSAICIIDINFLLYNFKSVIGTEQKRRKKIVSDLNLKYQSHMRQDDSNEIGYGRMVVNYSPIVFSDLPYVHHTPFLRNGRLGSSYDSDVGVICTYN